MSTIGLGVVEGFYGQPWTHDERLRIIEALGRWGLTTYLQAPKRDRSTSLFGPLDAETIGRVEGISEAGLRFGVRVVHGLSPYRLVDRESVPLLRRNSAKPRRALAERVRELVRRGVSEFAILFDDTWATLAPRFATVATGREHGELACEALDAGASRVVVVPAVYFGRAEDLSAGAKRYLDGLRLTGRWLTAWTGSRVFSPFISERERTAMEALTGLDVWIWSNAIANDWLPLATGESLGRRGREKLCFGPVHTVSPELVARGRGVLLNGAREAVPTLVALHVLADFARTGDLHRFSEALPRAMQAVFGDASESVLELARSVGAHDICFPHLARTPSVSHARALEKLRGADTMVPPREHEVLVREDRDG